MHLHHRILLSVQLGLLLTCGLAARAVAGTIILDDPDPIEFSGFGSALAVVGDVDGDKVPDYLVGSYTHRVGGVDRQGRAFVFSGRSGKLLYIVDDPLPQSQAAFGYSVAGAGDINKDGVPDLLIGAFGQGGSGRVFVFSGKDGKLLYSLQAPQPELGGGFGWAVDALGDLTGDGVAELIIGAFAQEGEGRVFIFNGHNGELLRTLAPPPASGSYTFGWSIAAAGDLDKDGAPDIWVGAPYTAVGDVHVQGRAYAFSGREGKLLLTIESPHRNAGAVFGWCVAANGDINKDGVPDVLIGAPYQDLGENISQGDAFAFSGADGKLLFSLKNPDPKPYASFGLMLASSPDVNGDGVPEILISAPYQDVDQFHVQGEVFVFNGQDGRHLVTFDNPDGHQGSIFGYAVVSPRDVDGDQIPEFVIGTPGQSIREKSVVGRVYVFVSES